MQTIRDVVRGAQLDAVTTVGRFNPLIVSDMLMEAQILDLTVDVVTSTAAVLFEFRTALEEKSGAFGLLVVRGCIRSDWQNLEGRPWLSAWNVVDSAPRYGDFGWEMVIQTSPDGELSLRGKSSEFYEIDVIGQMDEIVDFTEHNPRDVVGGLPEWDSECVVRANWRSIPPQ